jgi:hypothetical protein
MHQMIRLLLCFVFSAGCVAHRTPAWERPGLPFGAVSKEILDDMVQKGDRAFAERADPAKLEDALENWRGALRYRPDDPALLVRISRASRLRAHSLTGNDADARASDGVAFAERALCARNSRLCDRANSKKLPGHVFNQAELADLAGLIAYSEALLEWSELHGMATLLAQHEWIIEAATRARQLDHTAEFGSPDRVLAIIWASLATDYGGDLAHSEERFEAALATAPGYLPTRLEYAARWCVRTRDGDRYRRLLKEAADADPNALPEAAPENRAAQERARALLAEARSW